MGIGLYVHWTFLFAVAFVAINNTAGGLSGVVFAISQLLGVFFFVTLHEYGHAMAARAFGISTADITLLPIGGVARLLRMPRIPWQELVVALAGPAVNVVMVAILLIGFFTLADPSVLPALASYVGSFLGIATIDDTMAATLAPILSVPSFVGYAALMLLVNSTLVVFNMIPAFPMDGGRVFRSLLAMTMDYRRATSIASKVGLVGAALMAIFALSASPPHIGPLLIAAFIAYAGLNEARQVEVMESVRGLTAGQVMIRTQATLPMDMPLSEIAKQWQAIPMSAIPIVSLVGSIVGVLHIRDVNRALAAGMDLNTSAGQLVDHDWSVGTIGADEELESALLRTGKQSRYVPVVDAENRLVGILHLDSMLARGELSKQVPDSDPMKQQGFDATS